MIPLSETTLQGMKVHAAIAGKALTQPVKQSDVIWHFVFKTCGKAKEPTFKFEQVALAVVMEYEDFQGAEENWKQFESTLANKADTDRGSVSIHLDMSSYLLLILLLAQSLFDRGSGICLGCG